MAASDAEVLNLAKQWIEYDPNPSYRAEVEELVKKNDLKELRSLFVPRISFGTAGLRSRMGPGYACINDLVVLQTSQGLLRYLEQVDRASLHRHGIVVGYDGRHHSKEYAALTAAVFLSQNIPVHLFSTLVPTPLVAFSVAQYHASAGVMVTASHNPKQDNGYKVYWNNNAQIIPPHDVKIADSILKNLRPWQNYSLNPAHPLLNDPLEAMTAKYMSGALAQCCFTPAENMTARLKVAYTAMHGVGAPWVEKVFQQFGLPAYIPVKEQISPDPEFPTVKFPNPEEGKGALALSIATANRNGCPLILANDPDADRLAVAEFPSLMPPTAETDPASWRIFNGNEIAFLLADWVWTNYKAKQPRGADLSKALMVSSTVSSKVVAAMAAAEGFAYAETLTGFKWMGNVACQMQQPENGGHKFLFAFEVEIGFLIGDMSFDKDGVRVAAAMVEMANAWRRRGVTLSTRLEQLYAKYGYFEMNPGYFFCDSNDKLLRVFQRLRNYPGGKAAQGSAGGAAAPVYPTRCGEFEIESVRDCTLGLDTSEKDGKSRLPVTADAQMITFRFTNGAVATLRNSGTEPKLKYYIEATHRSSRKQARQLVDHLTQTLITEFIQPQANGLVPQAKL